MSHETKHVIAISGSLQLMEHATHDLAWEAALRAAGAQNKRVEVYRYLGAAVPRVEVSREPGERE